VVFENPRAGVAFLVTAAWVDLTIRDGVLVVELTCRCFATRVLPFGGARRGPG